MMLLSSFVRFLIILFAFASLLFCDAFDDSIRSLGLFIYMRIVILILWYHQPPCQQSNNVGDIAIHFCGDMPLCMPTTREGSCQPNQRTILSKPCCLRGAATPTSRRGLRIRQSRQPRGPKCTGRGPRGPAPRACTRPCGRARWPSP